MSPAGASWLNVACIIYIVYIAQTFDVLLFSQGSLSFNSLGLKIIWTPSGTISVIGAPQLLLH